MMRYLIAVLSLAGAVVSVLTLQLHYATGTAPCDINAHWDCGVVNHSPFAVIDHVPVAVIGIVGYLILAGLALAGQRFFLVLAAFSGFAFALHLTFIEKYVLEVYCLYCVISQCLIALIVLLSVIWLGAEHRRLKRNARHRITLTP
ncbi:MAG TPA: vitamin K epoxide reductase family protein [Terracidiphilus sp.]|nr:vitamin K epoxide reductase family protein [Terracidiphilus sp.]